LIVRVFPTDANLPLRDEMEIDIELNIRLEETDAGAVQDSLRGKFELVRFSKPQRFGLRRLGPPETDRTIDDASSRFLASVAPIHDVLMRTNGVLRVGVFVSQKEAVAFSADLSETTIQALARLRLGVEINFFPVS
jgi:hypothetical protein